MVTVSALATTLFLGGWRAPWPISIWDGANTGWWPMLWFFVKVVVALFVFIWLRGTLPRLRYDQFMRFGWKVLVPISLVWILVVATMRTVAAGDLPAARWRLVGVPARPAVRRRCWSPVDRQPRHPVMAAEASRRGRTRSSRSRRPGRRAARRPTGAQPADGFPIPPMDLRCRRRGCAAAGAATAPREHGARLTTAQ